MNKLYKIIKTDTIDTCNAELQKIEILFDLEGSNYKIFDTFFYKNIICAYGRCNLILQKSKEKITLKLNNPNKTICVKNDINLELEQYNKDTKIVIQYIQKPKI